jgi:prepilin-type N-terminal cleavage/methylation domain-containing protein
MKKLIHKKLKKTSEKLKLFFKGFTIIELITVIAIIGVLASVILVYVTSYIGKSRDSRIKAEVSEIAKDAMMYYANNVSYEGYVVPSSFKPVVLGSDYEFLTDGVNSYVVYAKLSTSNAYWCIDHTGAVLQIDNPPNSGVYVCSAGNGGGTSYDFIVSCSNCDPDPSGGYLEDGTCSGLPMFRRDDSAFWLWSMEAQPVYTISLECGLLPGSWWTLDGGPVGNYEPYDLEISGNPVVSAP